MYQYGEKQRSPALAQVRININRSGCIFWNWRTEITADRRRKSGFWDRDLQWRKTAV